MLKLLTAALLAAAIAAPALAEKTPQSFTRDGETYRYTATPQAGGVMITGRSAPSGRTFSLLVRGNRVSGTSNDVAVAFTMPATRARTPAEIAAR